MTGGEPAHDRVIADLDVTRECSVVRKHNGVADVAIVADMAVGEIISAMPDPRFARRGRAAIDRDEFAKRIFIADLEVSRFALILQVLRWLADGAISEEFVLCPGGHWSCERDVILEPTIQPERNTSSDDAVRPDDRSRPDFRASIHDRGRVNLRVAH